MDKSVCFALVFLCITVVQGSGKNDDSEFGFYRIKVRNLEQVSDILYWKKISGGDLSFRINMNQKQMDVLVTSDKKEDFLRFLARGGYEWVPLKEDLTKLSGKLIHIRHGQTTYRQSYNNLKNVSYYMSYTEILNYAYSLLNVRNPENYRQLVQLEIIGKSYFGEDVVMIKISSDHGRRKPIVLLEAGMHAREWVGPVSVVHLVQQLVERFDINKDMLHGLDFYIIPIANPDGYEYSRNHDRMWRKTMSSHGNCKGVDGNRNFDYYWGYVGASTNPCSDIYKGESPFSEIETQNIRDVAIKYQARLLGYISVHSYGGYLLYPWGFSKELPFDWQRLDVCAAKFSRAVENFSGTKYEYGTSANVLYEASGGSDDWMKGKLGVPYSYTLEIATPEKHSFTLEAHKLPTVTREVFEGIRALTNCFVRLRSLTSKTHSFMRRRYYRRRED